MKSYSNKKPAALEKCWGGRCLYHWGIEEQTIPDEDGERVEYKYNEVDVYEPLSENKILQRVINELWDKDEEQKLINEYNAYMLGIGDESAKTAYEAFLKKRAEIKAQVEADCEEAGVK